VLAAMWKELLGIDSAGVRDNFFQLGGHSLLVTQLIFRLREVFGVEISLRAIFDRPTVAELTELLLAEPDQRDRVEQAAIAVVAGTRESAPDRGAQ